MLRLLPALLVLVGCARDVRTVYPRGAPGDPTGTITLVFTRPSPDVYVAVNGHLVVDGAHTARVRIDGVATGYADVAVALGPGEQQLRVWVEPDRETVLPLGAPGGTATDTIKSMVLSIAALVIYAAIR